MKYFKASLLLTGLGGSTVLSSGFSTTCSDISLVDSWLVGTCPKGDGTEIKSSVYLPSKIENSQGTLAWSADGQYSNTCQDCELIDSNSTLQCYCYGTYASQDGTSTLDLEQHIDNYSGHLLSNLTGAITSIPADLSYPVPSSFVTELELSPINNSCSDHATFTVKGPSDCWYLNLGVVELWKSGISVNNQGWNIKGYATTDCTGGEVLVITPDDDGTCLSFASDVQGFSFTPLWNAD
ncbi:hypothetical protein N7495_003515 [Penicillium taxi]|uniref:uncharacterized protein n=1 Tax=Penicillium taxi TaxID=168475 RepID=UPI0025450B9F|nr:uncharacterized protein N7495_003515 [Penicillium taxi]KAJ5898771.1 hypothetical protein N7495_003515 [Penicillium taxi]